VAAWLVLRGLAGVGSAWVFVFASSWSLGRLGAAGQPELSGVVFAGVGVGIAAAGSLCLLFMQVHAGSAGAWQGLGLIALVVTAVIWRAVGAGELESDRASRQPSAAGFRWTGDSARLVLAYGILGFGYIIPATFVPAMARQLVKDPLIFGSSWPIFGIAAAVSPLLLSGLPMRVLGNQGLWTLSQLLMALGVASPIFRPGVGGVMAAALLVGGTFMVSTMAGMREARARGGAHATRLMAMMTTAFAIGQILGPLLVAHTVGPDGDFIRPLSMAAVLLVVSAVGLPPARRP
jgi:hypothetical protein